MWNPSSNSHLKKMDDLLQESREVSLELTKLDNESVNFPFRNINATTLAEVPQVEKALNNQINQRVQALGKAVENGIPQNANIFSTAELEECDD